MGEKLAGDTPIRMSPDLQVILCERVFRQTGRVHVPDFLTPESAKRLLACLTNETEWCLALNNGSESIDLDAKTLAAMPLEKRAAMAVHVTQTARYDFQYIYENHRMSDDGEPYPDPSHFHARIVEFLNSAPFLQFARRVTGIPSIALTDVQATKYTSGHFLTQHDDRSDTKKRRAAYVLNLTPKWKPDWGGVLQFIDRDGHVAEGYTPTFNAINILRVPQPHLVSYVAPYADGARYSITGWLRDA